MEPSEDLNQKLLEVQLRHLEHEVRKSELECRELARHPFLRETFMLAFGSLLLTVVTAVPSVFTAWTATRNTQNVLIQRDRVQRELNEESQLARQQDNSRGDFATLQRQYALLEKTLELLQQQGTDAEKLAYQQARHTAAQQLSELPADGKVSTIYLATEEQRPRAESLKAALKESGIEVADIRPREGAAPYTTEVRYLNGSGDMALAESVLEKLKDPKIGENTNSRAIPFNNDEAPPHQVEVHFGKEIVSTGN